MTEQVILSYHMKRQCGNARPWKLHCPNAFKADDVSQFACRDQPPDIICSVPNAGWWIPIGETPGLLPCCVATLIDGVPSIPRFVEVNVQLQHIPDRCIPGCCEAASSSVILEWDGFSGWRYMFPSPYQVCNDDDPCFDFIGGSGETALVSWDIRCGFGGLILRLSAIDTIADFTTFPIFEGETDIAGPPCFDPEIETSFNSYSTVSWPCQPVSITAKAYIGA